MDRAQSITMSFNINSGYGATVAGQYVPVSPNGRQFFVGEATLDNLRQVQDIFHHDINGVQRLWTTLASAVAATFQNIPLAVTVTSAAPGVITSTTPHGIANGDKVYLSGTTAPTGLTLGVVYYAVNVTSTTLQVSLQRGGTGITTSSTGTAVVLNILASIGDTIYILPSHNENVSSATALNINASGLTIIGLGNDETRPTFYLDTATTSTVSITGPGTTIRNVIFDGTGYAAIASIMTITASDVLVQGCKFIMSNSTNQAGIAITTNALANRLVLDSNYFYGDTAGTTNAIQLIGGNDIRIINNRFFAPFTTSLGAINNITTACLRIFIQNNMIDNTTASSTKAIVLLSSTTGQISFNLVQILSGTAPFTAAAASWVGNNYYSATIGAAGTLI